MGASRDDLPAVPDDKPPTLPTVLWQLANLVFKREAVMLLAAMALLVGGGGATVVYGQGYLDGGMEKRIAPLERRQDMVEADVAEVKKTSAEALRVSLETNLNVRLIAERLNLRPITLEAKDGGPP